MMRCLTKVPKEPEHNERRHIKMFRLWPTKCDDGHTVFLGYTWVCEQYCAQSFSDDDDPKVVGEFGFVDKGWYRFCGRYSSKENSREFTLRTNDFTH